MSLQRTMLAGVMAFLVGVSSVWADSIRVAGALYENVKVVESPTRYYFKTPDEGKVISIAKDQVKPEDLQFDAESLELRALRAAAQEAEQSKAPRRKSLVMPEVEPVALPTIPDIPSFATAAIPKGFTHYEDAAGSIAVDYPQNWFAMDLSKAMEAAGGAQGLPLAGMMKGVAIASRKEALDMAGAMDFDLANLASLGDKIDTESASVAIVRMNMQGMNTQGMGFSPMQMLNTPGFAEGIKMIFPNAEIVQSPAPTTIGGRSGVSLIIRIQNSKGVSLTMGVILAADASGMVTVSTQYPSAREAEFKPPLTTVINSVRFK